MNLRVFFFPGVQVFPIIRLRVEKTRVAGRWGLARVQRRSFHAPLAHVLIWKRGQKWFLENMRVLGAAECLGYCKRRLAGIEKGPGLIGLISTRSVEDAVA